MNFYGPLALAKACHISQIFTDRLDNWPIRVDEWHLATLKAHKEARLRTISRQLFFLIQLRLFFTNSAIECFLVLLPWQRLAIFHKSSLISWETG